MKKLLSPGNFRFKRITQFFIIVSITFSCTLSSAQSWRHILDSIPENYFDLRQQLEDYYNEHNSLKAQKGSGYKEFVRWTLFWDGRIDQNGSYLTANQKMYQHYEYLKTQGSQGSNLPFQPDWEALGPLVNEDSVKAEMGLVSKLWVDTTDFQKIYAGSNSGGLFVTINGGNTWTSLTDNIGALGIRDIIVHPGDPDTILIATGTRSLDTHYGYGILKSDDGGETWNSTVFNPLNITNNLVFTNIIKHPDSAGYYYALGVQNFGAKSYIFKTKDRFETVDTVLTIQADKTTRKELFDIEFKPDDASTIYASGHVLCKSTDYGMTWDTNFHSNLNLAQHHILERLEMAVHQDNANMLLAICEIADTTDKPNNVYYRRLFRSLSGGNSFNEIPPTDSTIKYVTTVAFDVGYYTMELEISPDDMNRFYTGGLWTRKYEIENDSARFIDIPDRVYHVDIRELQVFYGDSEDIVYLGNDGGVTKSLDGGDTWIDCSTSGLNITQFYKFGLADQSAYILGGTQDGNNNMYNLNTNKWITRFGDANEMIFDYNNPDTIYATDFCSFYSILRSDDGGETFYRKINFYELDSVYSNHNAFVMHPNDPATLFLGLHDIYKTQDKCKSWDTISNFTTEVDAISTQNLRDVGISKTNPDFMYAGFYHPTWDHDSSDTVRLVRTKDGGTTWEDITGLVNYDWAGISDILVSPNDSSRFWVTLWQNWAGYRIYQYDQCGDVMTNFSDGLPDLPVNCIIYNERKTDTGIGEEDELFAGTDAGVYYRNAEMDAWKPFTEGMPLSMVSDLEINYKTNKLVASTFGRGMWQTGLPDCEQNNDTLVIREDTVWNDMVWTCKHILIKAAKTLTVKGRLYMNKDKKIFVEQGGRLIVDGGHIMSGCGEFWYGIEVWGSPTMLQDQMFQGSVKIINNGLIADAKIGVRLGKSSLSCDNIPPQPYAASGGGILETKEATFKNNMIAIYFDPYARQDNVSKIEKSTFITNEAMIMQTAPYAFMDINGVKGLEIRGAVFVNNTPIDTLDYKVRGMGIVSMNADYRINKYIEPLSLVKSEFKKLYYGIKALSSVTTKTVTIDSSKFKDNRCGIYLSGITSATITSNEFLINYETASDTVSGLYLDNCTGYTIEENQFKGCEGSGSNGNWFGLGCVINNSGEQNNNIYRNNFSKLNVGTLVLNKNRDLTGEYGLQIICNDYEVEGNCDFDIFVTKQDSLSGMGIAADQGSDDNDPAAPAGNIFTSDPDDPQGNYKNTTEDITYHHHSETTGYQLIPENHTHGSVTPSENGFGQQYDESESCPSNIESGQSKGENRINKSISEQKIDSTRNLLNLLVDGSDTEFLNTEVQTSWPDESYELYNELLNESPYLSDTVLVSAVNKENVLSSTMITDVLVANPQSAKSDTVMESVSQRINQLSDEQMEDVEQGLYIIGAKESLESKLSSYRASYDRALKNLIRIFRNDTISESPSDSIICLLQQENWIWAKYALAFEYYEKGDSLNVENTLESVPLLFTLTSLETYEHQLYEDYFGILLSLRSEVKSIFEADSMQKITLHNILNNSNGSLKARVRNILICNDSLSYNEPYIFPEPDLKSNIIVLKPAQTEYQENILKVYPNPAYNYIIVEFGLEYVPIDGFIRFVDVNGKHIRTYQINNLHDHLIIPLAEMCNGIYFCQLIEDNNLIESCKFVVNK